MAKTGTGPKTFRKFKRPTPQTPRGKSKAKGDGARTLVEEGVPHSRAMLFGSPTGSDIPGPLAKSRSGKPAIRRSR